MLVADLTVLLLESDALSSPDASKCIPSGTDASIYLVVLMPVYTWWC